VSALAAAAAVIIATVLAGNLIRIPLLSAGAKSAPLIPLDIAVALFVGVGLIEALRRRRFVVDAPTVAGAVFLLIAAAGLISAGPRVGLSSSELVFGGAYLVRWALYFGVFVVATTLLERREAILIGRLLRLAIVVFAAFGIVQVIAFPGFAQMVYPDSAVVLDWDWQGRRLVSTFLDPNYAGILIVVGLSLWGGALLANDRAPVWEGLVLGVALLLTLSRGSMLAAVCGGLTLLWIRGLNVRAARATIGAVFVVLLTVPFVLSYAVEYNKLVIDESALQRVLAWGKGLILLAEYPVLGVGFNTVGFVLPRYGLAVDGTARFGLDGGLLFIAVLTGAVGVVAFIGLLVMVVRAARITWRDPQVTPAVRGLALAVPASVVAVTVQATFANTLLLSLLLAPSWLLWSLPRALRRDPPPAVG
jgi:hypothetical protein